MTNINVATKISQKNSRSSVNIQTTSNYSKTPAQHINNRYKLNSPSNKVNSPSKSVNETHLFRFSQTSERSANLINNNLYPRDVADEKEFRLSKNALAGDINIILLQEK
eukprot:GHVR01152857.1.p1 GENE.GHVR01152857.1~~GHVR01152857.1.p1  ORF type:complete len:109 (+),score=1.63 GHVR01152857.1:1158-1484(+)